MAGCSADVRVWRVRNQSDESEAYSLTVVGHGVQASGVVSANTDLLVEVPDFGGANTAILNIAGFSYTKAHSNAVLSEDECQEDPGDDGEDPGDIVAEAPEPALIQITVWPDNNGQTDALTGVTWTIDGNPIYTDANGNGLYDVGEEIVTAVEYRDRPVCGDSSPVVEGQAMSRLVLNMTLDDIDGGDLDAFLARFEARINGVPVVFGWYDIGGEFAPCLPAFEGATQYRAG